MPRYRWVSPPGWPPPPPGWRPPPGWQPDPSWPPAPATHVFWERRSWSRRRRLTVVAATTLAVVAAFGGCAAVAASDDGCGFDLPPGDVGRAHVVNDGQQPLDLFECSDAGCTSGRDLRPLPPGQDRSTSFELCSGTSIGLTDPRGALQGCLALPVGETVTEPTYRASHFDRTCAGDGTIHPRIT